MPELIEAQMYFMCASAFGWTPQQVDQIKMSLLMKMLALAEAQMGIEDSTNVDQLPVEGKQPEVMPRPSGPRSGLPQKKMLKML